MLNSVPRAINAASRQVTLRHPNSFACVVSRKVVKRVEEGADGKPSESAGLPTLGGMGVMRSEDEADFAYVELGAAKMLFAGPGPYQQMDANERDSAMLTEMSREVLIESVAAPDAPEGEPQYFVADSGDLVNLVMETGDEPIVLSYEVASVVGNVSLPPYTRRLVLNPRDDLNYLAPFTD